MSTNIPDYCKPEALILSIREQRKQIKSLADNVIFQKKNVCRLKDHSGHAEAMANVTLAYRHLEDAAMRLGKVIQAIDGGVSCYDKAETLGRGQVPPGPAGSVGVSDPPPFCGSAAKTAVSDIGITALTCKEVEENLRNLPKRPGVAWKVRDDGGAITFRQGQRVTITEYVPELVRRLYMSEDEARTFAGRVGIVEYVSADNNVWVRFSDGKLVFIMPDLLHAFEYRKGDKVRVEPSWEKILSRGLSFSEFTAKEVAGLEGTVFETSAVGSYPSSHFPNTVWITTAHCRRWYLTPDLITFISRPTSTTNH